MIKVVLIFRAACSFVCNKEKSLQLYLKSSCMIVIYLGPIERIRCVLHFPFMESNAIWF